MLTKQVDCRPLSQPTPKVSHKHRNSKIKKEKLLFPETIYNKQQNKRAWKFTYTFNPARETAFHKDLRNVKWLLISCPDKMENFRIT